MLNIAICDDAPDQLRHIAALTTEYIETHQANAKVHTFFHPDDMLKTAETSQFHIYILDIVMPMMTGIELGTALRRFDREAQIIYATTAPEFALESFAANPIGYLVKPVVKEKFFESLDLAFSKMGTQEESTIAVKTKYGLRVLNVSAIVCCERIKNAVKFTLATGESVESLSIRIPFSDYVAPLLHSEQFIQPHTSYILNMNRVERITNNEFVMRGGAVVPISQKQLAAVRQIYLDYIFGKGVK